MNFYPRFPGDYSRKTQSLELIEHGALNRLLDFQYATEQPLPEDSAARHRICGASNRAERAAVDRVVGQFFTRLNDGLWNTRAREVIEDARPRIEAARRNGALGGRVKRHSEFEPNRNPAGSPLETQREPNGLAHHSPITTFIPNGMNKARGPRFDVLGWLIERGVTDQVARDWYSSRKKKPTLTALEAIEREAGKAGWTLTEALREGCARSWEGFKADWVQARAGRVSPADIARITVPGPTGEDPTLRKIRADEANATPMPPEVRAKLNALRCGADTPGRPTSAVAEGAT